MSKCDTCGCMSSRRGGWVVCVVCGRDRRRTPVDRQQTHQRTGTPPLRLARLGSHTNRQTALVVAVHVDQSHLFLRGPYTSALDGQADLACSLLRSRYQPSQLADRRHQIRTYTVSIVCNVYKHMLTLLPVPGPILQEPRKSDAPQLRDEYRSYKILSGCRASPLTFSASRASLVPAGRC